MPRKAKNVKSKRKRKSRPRYVLNLSAGQPHGLAPLAKIKWSYESSQTLGDGTTTANASYQFTANSAYDFYAASGTNQPPWYDTFCNGTTWIRNRVLGLNTDFTFINLGTAATRVAVYVTDSSVDMKSLSTYQLNNDKMVKSAILSPAGGSKDTVRFRKYFSFTKLIGKKILYEDSYKHGYNADPSDKIYLYIVAQTLDGSNTCEVMCEQSTIQTARLEDLNPGANHIEN